MKPRCVWATVDSGSCPFNASERIGGIALCSRHHIDLRFFLSPPGAPPYSGGVVYYVGDPRSQQVKIGFSTDLKKRVGTLRSSRPGALLLAFEPGPMTLERQRHREYRSLQEPKPSGEREWFRRAPVLMDHVTKIRAFYGMRIVPAVPLRWIAPVRRDDRLGQR